MLTKSESKTYDKVSTVLKAGTVCVGKAKDGRALAAGEYPPAKAVGGYALLLEGFPVTMGTCDEVSRAFAVISRSAIVYSVDNPKGIPPKVERYYQETVENQPGMPPSRAWAVAWSRYCAYTNPKSKHCRKPQSEYFPGKNPTDKPEKRKNTPLKITLHRVEGPPHLVPEIRVVQRVSEETDLYRKADAVLKEWVLSMPGDTVNFVKYEIDWDNGQAMGGEMYLSRDWVARHSFAESLKSVVAVLAGRGTLQKISPVVASEFVDWGRVLREYDFGDTTAKPDAYRADRLADRITHMIGRRVRIRYRGEAVKSIGDGHVIAYPANGKPFTTAERRILSDQGFGVSTYSAVIRLASA